MKSRFEKNKSQTKQQLIMEVERDGTGEAVGGEVRYYNLTPLELLFKC